MRRFAVIALALFELCWLNMILPGHTRGIVTMPCCAAEQTQAQQTSAPVCPRCAAERRSHPSPTPADRAHCALCFFAAHLTIPPALDLTAPQLRFLNYVDSQDARHLFARQVTLPFDGTGPPSA
jgi:hypothetical protein